MKVFILLQCLVSLTLAEPPVGDGYPAARSSHDHHHDHDHDDQHDHHTSEHQRSQAQDYTPSSYATSRNPPSTEYGTPNARSAQNSRGPTFAPPTVRVSFNQRFGSSAARSSSQGHSRTAAKSLSQEYAAPNARQGISEEYGPPARSLSQEYGVPSVSARTLSTEYGVPNARSSPSEQYGAPIVDARSSQKPQSPVSNFRSAEPALSEDYSAPAARSQFHADSLSQGYNAPSSRSNDVAQGSSKSVFSARTAPSSTYGAPASRSLSTSYGVPSARSSEAQSYDSVSQTYDAYNQGDVSETYGVPNARSLSQEYGVPSSRANENNDAVGSSYASASSRSAPSSTYLPSARDNAPSQQYGVPEQDSQGYDSAKARALNELLNQEPASYDFAYQIEDGESGSDFGHTETRQENRAEGSYFIVRPDGSKQTVEYTADERGFKPRISVEPAAGGYDENAADVTGRAAGGPY